MDLVYQKYKAMQKNPGKMVEELGLDGTSLSSNGIGTGVIRKETDLNNDEKQFLLAVERGDIPTARHFLEESQIYFNININCVDPLGRTALLIAIENENIELMQVLLSYNVEIGDALLHAISEENVEAVELLLAFQQHKKDLSGVKGSPSKPQDSGFLGGVPSSSFTPDITPIILAAHKDNYEIIKILLDRGDRISKPHDVRCNCGDCVFKSNEDSLNHSRSRINAYRALASPSLISLSSKDPILTSFELSWELKRLSRLENEFKSDYEELAKQCQDFAVDLLDQTRGSKELEVILNHDTTGPANEMGDKMSLSRLKLAIKYKQKRFVAHPNCQQLLASLWYEGLPGFRRKHIVFKVLLTVSVCLLYPILSIFYLIIPKSVMGRFMRRPFIKFICHSASYMTFLFLLILASQRIDSIIKLGGSDDNLNAKMTREVRGAPPTSIEWMILAYVAGLIWAEVKQLWDEGAKTYAQDMWNILDFITNSLYIATFTLKLVAYLRVKQELRDNNPAAHLTRDKWDAYDPNLISEGMFAAANIFSSLKLIYIFTVNPHLGPLQITLGRMVYDIMKFTCIVILVVFSYACGINQLYWYYAEARTKDCQICMADPDQEDTQICNDNCDRTLSNLFEILQTLYFAVYGLIELRHFELREKHEFTQFVGKLMFGTYCFIMIIVLLNMLIAMLSNSYQYISNDSDTEWKYARSKLWMSYFQEGGTVPPPFNILPTPKTLWYILVAIKNTLCRCSQRHKRSKWQSIRKLVKKVNEREAKYQIVMRDLVKRYIMKKQKSGQTEGVTEDDLNEIKQDISSFRYELLEILRNNGMNTPSSTQPAKSNSKLRRKASRLSVEKLQKQMQQRNSRADDNKDKTAMYQMPLFLQKSSSFGSSNSGGLSNQSSLDIPEEIPEEQGGNWSKIQDHRFKDKSSSVNSVAKSDEGLGESFDLQSDLSEASIISKLGNGVKNNQTCDTVLEENLSDADVHLQEQTVQNQDPDEADDSTNPDMSLDSSPPELTLDPSKLESPYDNHNDNLENIDNPFADKKVGSIKKVSFLWDSQEDSDGIEPVSDTYIYEGKGKKSFAKKFIK